MPYVRLFKVKPINRIVSSTVEVFSERKCTREREKERKKPIEMQTNKLQRVKRKINRYRNVHE